MIEFFHDITDLAECYDTFSVTDYAESKVPYSYDVNYLNLTLLGVAILEWVQRLEFSPQLYGNNRM